MPDRRAAFLVGARSSPGALLVYTSAWHDCICTGRSFVGRTAWAAWEAIPSGAEALIARLRDTARRLAKAAAAFAWADSIRGQGGQAVATMYRRGSCRAGSHFSPRSVGASSTPRSAKPQKHGDWARPGLARARPTLAELDQLGSMSAKLGPMLVTFGRCRHACRIRAAKFGRRPNSGRHWPNLDSVRPGSGQVRPQARMDVDRKDNCTTSSTE